MTEQPYNPDDLGFLASRRLDEELSADEQARLDDALANQPELKEEARQLAAVHDLVKQWGAGADDVDSEPFVGAVLSAIEDQGDAEQSHRLDGLLTQWRADAPDVDEDDFVQGVMRRVTPQQSQPGYWRIIRFGVPLAAAAAVMFTVTTTLRQPQVTQPGSTTVVWGRDTVVPQAPSMIVAWERSDSQGVSGSDSGEVGFVSVGAEPMLLTDVEALPS